MTEETVARLRAELKAANDAEVSAFRAWEPLETGHPDRKRLGTALGCAMDRRREAEHELSRAESDLDALRVAAALGWAPTGWRGRDPEAGP